MNLINIPKVAFFDFDGTIAATRFVIPEKGVIRECMGFDIPTWSNYAKTQREGAYRDSRVVQPVIDYAMELKKKGCQVNVLTVAYSEEESVAKLVFLNLKNIRHVFEEVYALSDPLRKAEYIEHYAMIRKIDIGDILIVEDSFQTCIECMQRGARAATLANIIADNVSN